jgi:CDP-glycerol glycerophosphotransferase (TagB/SpsB family)
MKRLIAAVFSLINACVPKDPRRVVFCSFPDYSDNARAVYEELMRKQAYTKYRLVWLIKTDELPELPHTRCVRLHSLRGMWQYFRAKYVFHTHGLFHNRPSARQVTVSLWHGMPLKTIMKLDATHPENEVFRFTYCLATSPLFQQIMTKAFGCEESQCLITGQPRNDALFASSDILAQMGIDRAAYDHLFLWMPTYRQSAVGDVRVDGNGGSEQGVAFLTSEQLDELNALLAAQNSLLLIKLHPMQVPVAAETKTFSHMRLLRQVPGQLYHLVGQADALLTDCSSVYIDYLMLDRPIGFVFDDMEQYQSNRGFVFEHPLEYMPGPCIGDYASLAAFLQDTAAGKDAYAPERRRVNEQFNTYCDNGSSDRLLKEVLPL